jgi:hypothetical protein
MKHKTRHELRQLVTQAAARQLPALPPRDRADLLEGIALFLKNPNERELSRHTVGLIRQTEEHQLILFGQLTGGDQ